MEISFEGNKITFYFTSDGRVDFRELVKDLAGVFRSRIELRQIGVRDEAKMLGGIGICGRPLCCSQFLTEFQPVSTKMAKTQSLSLNPTKISGTCGRLMCCLRYEEEAYEGLVKAVPKNGAFVETPAGFGTVTQVNILRGTVKVRLDGEGEAVFKNYSGGEVAVVPGGRPKNGEAPAHVLQRREEPETPEAEDEPAAEPVAELEEEPRRQSSAPVRRKSSQRRGGAKRGERSEGQRREKAERGERADSQRRDRREKREGGDERRDRREKREGGDERRDRREKREGEQREGAPAYRPKRRRGSRGGRGGSGKTPQQQ